MLVQVTEHRFRQRLPLEPSQFDPIMIDDKERARIGLKLVKQSTFVGFGRTMGQSWRAMARPEIQAGHDGICEQHTAMRLDVLMENA